jgi:hypothetical protein
VPEIPGSIAAAARRLQGGNGKTPFGESLRKDKGRTDQRSCPQAALPRLVYCVAATAVFIHKSLARFAILEWRSWKTALA